MPKVAQRQAAKAFAALILLVPAICVVALAQGPAPVVVTPHGDNAAAQQDKPYVILVSMDGFRYDYARRYGAKNILALANRGVSAPDGMLPVSPSITFPNHYSIVTGLYPENHGIVANSFYDPALRERFVFSDQNSAGSGMWYGGVPLWVLAERQGMRTACFFWPGSEAEIGRVRPTYYLRFDSRVPDETRVDQVIAWLRLPPGQRPHFITLYFSDTDTAGHATGTNSPEIAAAVQRLDAMIARLVAGVALVHLPVDIVLVSDHGMINTQGPWINLDKFADLSGFETVGSLLYAANDAAAERAYSQLKGASDKFVVYRRSGMPERLHFNANARIGDPVVVPTGPYLIRARGSNDPKEVPPKGMHGYDPATMMEMRAVFYAAGPDFRPGARVAPFENIHLYPLVAKILGLEVGRIDGDAQVLQGVLQTRLPELRRPGSLLPSRPQR